MFAGPMPPDIPPPPPFYVPFFHVPAIQEALQPAKTNQTRTPPPGMKKAKIGVENKAEGAVETPAGAKGKDGATATKKKTAKAAPKSGGKQASMMSFFKKA